MAEGELLQNVVLSLNPCPICVDAGEQEPMTFEEWASSEWGLPGSGGRYCLDKCHCVLLPPAIIDQFPALNEKVHLRGEEGTEILAVVDIYPGEMGLKDIKEKWMATRGRLPKEIYDMALEDIGPYLLRLMGEGAGA